MEGILHRERSLKRPRHSHYSTAVCSSRKTLFEEDEAGSQCAIEPAPPEVLSKPA
jgi:hypothetical protein